uniref:Uncharacterized protein n=2 Tax=Oncorhynchus tshawytscha TaxID=74940 RepID=A0AAZ3QX17_ONCTS
QIACFWLANYIAANVSQCYLAVAQVFVFTPLPHRTRLPVGTSIYNNSTRALHVTAASWHLVLSLLCCQNRAARIRVGKGDRALTYEQAPHTHHIGHRKGWLSQHTSNNLQGFHSSLELFTTCKSCVGVKWTCEKLSGMLFRLLISHDMVTLNKALKSCFSAKRQGTQITSSSSISKVRV